MKTHGESKCRLYRIWTGMKKRCINPHCKDYSFYGARGITVCKEWQQSYEAFRDWSLCHGYEEYLTLDRIDGTKNYSPDNCRWVDRIEQSRNLKTTRFFTYRGETKTASEWSKIYGIPSRSIRFRIDRGWTIEQALTEPLQQGRKAIAWGIK